MNLLTEMCNEILQSSSDPIFSLLPQPRPTPKRSLQSKVIAHRGVFDNRHIFENTLDSFTQCMEHKIWGLELDLRWTEDLHPIILHDRDCGRVFGRPEIIPQLHTLDLLRQRAPFIPTLQEALDLCGFQIHLMIEIKESLSDPHNLKISRLAQCLKNLRPGIDYHFMSFSPEWLKRIDFVPPQTLLTIADWNLKQMSSWTLQYNWGGITGHYLLMSQKVINLHHQAQQKTGVGFISSRNSLYREVNRGVDWLFTNHPIQIQSWLDDLIKKTSVQDPSSSSSESC